MNIIKSEVSVIEQEPGIEGLYRFMEKCGRVTYKTEDKITQDSYSRFIKNVIYDRGHWAVFNLGTVYLKFGEWYEYNIFNELKKTAPWTKWQKIEKDIYLTTNYRVICQLGLQDFMETYWVEPTEYHYHRVGAKFICNRTTSHQLVRHRILCPLQESQRYCNYSRDKFGNELTFILPQWIYKERDIIGNTVDPLTGESRKYILSLDGVELWDTLCCCSRVVASRDKFWKYVEDEYMYELSDECELIPEDARGVLCGDIKTELCMVGYVEDWYYEPPKDSKEKAGFFTLRSAKDAQSDIRVLSNSLKEQFGERGYDKLK